MFITFFCIHVATSLVISRFLIAQASPISNLVPKCCWKSNLKFSEICGSELLSCKQCCESMLLHLMQLESLRMASSVGCLFT